MPDETREPRTSCYNCTRDADERLGFREIGVSGTVEGDEEPALLCSAMLRPSPEESCTDLRRFSDLNICSESNPDNSNKIQENTRITIVTITGIIMIVIARITTTILRPSRIEEASGSSTGSAPLQRGMPGYARICTGGIRCFSVMGLQGYG